MPNYVKFLNELLVNKRKLDDSSTVELNAICSGILQNKLSNKFKDTRSFTIPCLIGSLNIDNALANLGASINVMPYKMFKQLGLGKPKNTRMSIQLADRTMRHPKGIIEDVLVKIDKFIFPVNFVVLNMDEDSEVPLILATARTIIDVGTSKLVLCIGDKKIILQARDSVRVSSERDDIKHLVNVSNHVAQPSLQEILRENMLEPCFKQGDRNRTTYEERTVQLDEPDEWRVHAEEKLKKTQ
ncbi:Retrovirus-related Pol polyprotein from transposon 17.6 [Gossypium australe]|uniref:Retrovirus-related Pol polyprotein from transposon 17.6 n=1 Tax=Gossypium australe TaxID=47621 RepID=A0A5B6UY30_9ROSI|nr:Retrovirus-related Pol polyprotein from transposon 17.6 [Gossypium australe]